MDPTIGPETDQSLAWAEEKTGHKFTEPDLKGARALAKLREQPESYDYDEENDVTTTLASAKWAENSLKINEPAEGTDKSKASIKERPWWNYLAKDQFDGMHQIAHEFNVDTLEREGIAKGPINERASEYH